MPEPVDGSDSASLPWRSVPFYVALACTLMGVMGVSLITPALPSVRAALGLTDAEVGLLITVYTLPGVVLTPFVGLLADRVGRRRTVVPLLFLFGASGSAIALGPQYEVILTLRFLQGVGASALVSLALTLIGDFYDGATQDAAVGLNGSVAGGGAAVYPLVGGALTTLGWHAPFAVYGVGVVVGAVALVRLPEPDGFSPVDARTYVDRIGAVLTDPRCLAVLAALLVAFFAFYGAIQTALPLLLDSEYGLSSGAIGVLLGLTAVATAGVASQFGRLSRWRSGPELVAVGFVTFGASLCGVWLADSPAGIGVSLLAFGAGFGLIMPAADTVVLALVSAELRAGVVGARTSTIRLGQTLGPLAFTLLAGTGFASRATGYRTLTLAAGAACLTAGLATYAALRHRR